MHRNRFAFLGALETGSWLDGRWRRAALAALAAANVAFAALAMEVSNHPPPGARPASADFVSFYAAGRLADEGRPWEAYDPAPHAAAEAAAAGPGRKYEFFFYPPPFLLACGALAWLPYWPALALFEAASLAAMMAGLATIAATGGMRRGSAWLLAAAYTPLAWNLELGQNAFASAALLAFGTLALERRPLASGTALGLLCYKPHLGLLLPVALSAGRRWRAFAAAAATVACACAAAWAAFGTRTWAAYAHAFLGSGSTYGSGRVRFDGMVSPFGAAMLSGAGRGASLAVQATATLACAAAVAWAWRRPGTQATRSASLLSATALALPVLLIYDQAICLVAIAWLLAQGRAQGFLPWEKTALAAAFAMPALALPAIIGAGAPLAPVPAAAVLAACLARTLRLGDAREEGKARQ